MSSEPMSVLFVDGDEEFRSLAETMLERADERLVVETVATPADADPTAFDCIVSEHVLPDDTGVAFLKRVRAEQPGLPFVIFTADGSEAVASEAISADVTEYMRKRSSLEQFELLANRIVNAVDRTRTEDRLERLEDRYQRVLETSPAAIVVFDETRIISYANEAATEMFGELEGHGVMEFIPPESEQVITERVQQVLDDGKPVEMVELAFRTATGETRHGLIASAPVSLGGDDAVQAVIVDITERKERERELRRYRTLVETMPDPAYALDRGGNYTLVNQAYVDEMGYDRAELLGSHISHVLGDEELDRGRAVVQTLLDADATASERYEQTVELANGERVTCIVHQTLIYEGGEWRGSVGTVRPESQDWIADI